MGKTKKGEATRALIYESAIHLFSTYGYEAVSIQRIADHAGTAKGSFYNYYTTKSDIIVEKFWEIDAYYRSIEEEVLQEPNGESRLLKFTRLQLTYVRDEVTCDVLKVLYANQVQQAGSDKTITNEHRFWFTFIVDIIAEAQQSGEFNSRESATTYARYFNRVIRGLFLDWNISSASFDLVEVGMHYCASILIEALKR
ncbi:MAG TPA: TetR/AcrR family transcriptional regulator [Sphaerochaeta sp.]|jgi:AcrR family transcriptional regulator|nr:TetR/AcrR family transcriptional regulator [Spirochaetales bacterium]HOE84889.1 TetR/AcrR family transcriptional regulator [Sphaerochaeta sp.]HOQ94935.1 TetR/AcrR family transcriptional regulator [Sphaerochaeta sp.]HPK47295.1 TetR/AcrR family transcriptional regulator [Sphaerochaeta sp.]HPY12314.1 TetR/AcrR family transcriptional regulator [Sphaerochaeta sp.]